MAEITVTGLNFEKEVMNSEVPVLLDFWANWCGPCKMLSPAVEEIARKYEGKVKVGKVNVDEEPGLAVSFHVDSIPALFLMKDGKIVKTSIGYQPIERIEAMLK